MMMLDARSTLLILAHGIWPIGGSTLNRNTPRRPRCCGVFNRRFFFAFSRDSRASQATLPYTGPSASPNLHAQLFRVPRCSSEQIK